MNSTVSSRFIEPPHDTDHHNGSVGRTMMMDTHKVTVLLGRIFFPTHAIIIRNRRDCGAVRFELTGQS